MAKITTLFGFLLIGLGGIGYFGPNVGAAKGKAETEAADATETVEAAKSSSRKTALIPAAVGLLLVVCGAIANNPKFRMHAMHAAVTIGLLGALAGGGRFLSKVSAFLSDDPDLNRRAFWFTGAMGLICAIFVVLCVRSFIAARKSTSSEGAEAS